MVEKVVLIGGVFSGDQDEVAVTVVLDILAAVSKSGSLARFDVELGQSLADLVREDVGIGSAETNFLKTSEGQVIVKFSTGPLYCHKYLILSWKKVNLKIKIP